MTTGMAEVTARISQLQTLLGVCPAGVLDASGSSGASTGTSTSTSTGTSSTTFAQTLDDVLNGTGAQNSTELGRQAVTLARGYSGVSYLWGGTNPAKGLDCSGLVQLVYGKLGIELPRIASDQAKAGERIPSLSQAQPGDLVFFGSPAHHVGIYAGDGQMIDAPRTGRTVGVHSIAGYGTVSEIRRVSGASTTTASASSARANTGTELLSASGLSRSSSGTAAASALSGPYASLFTEAGRRYGVDPALLSAIARTESNYNPSAVSSAGARGLMQLMPGTARSLGVDPDKPAQAVDGAARLMANLLRQFHGQTDLALAGYNAGPNAVRRFGGVPPYSETRTYVQRVTSAWEALR